jgi:4-diphosphocytidyl-2C-methyl-D-erythritol kinase
MLQFPICKINLGLYITSKRADGYHNLETVFYPVSLYDALEVIPAMETNLHLSGRTVAGDVQNNLVWKAYEMMKAEFPDVVQPLDIFLHKALPMGAGLGGGSADGAFMLRLLNDFYKLGLDKETLAAKALQLGSDCPFFIYNTPQFAEGRGEMMQQVEVDLSAYTLQLVCPDVHISTANAFSMITPRPAPFDLRTLAQLPIQDWKNNITNDFEQPIFEQVPELARIKQQLYDGGALYASMSGSGSTIYGIFPKDRQAVISTDLNFENYSV